MHELAIYLAFCFIRMLLWLLLLLLLYHADSFGVASSPYQISWKRHIVLQIFEEKWQPLFVSFVGSFRAHFVQRATTAQPEQKNRKIGKMVKKVHKNYCNLNASLLHAR